MTLIELISRYATPATSGVPAWMMGHYRRDSITFANGQTDRSTQVHWFQSRNLTIDLRLPAGPALPTKPLAAYPADELSILANHEGWAAPCRWDGQALSWQPGASLQLHNRWPEPALLQRVGNCMIEFSPGGAYVEDWRLQPGPSGPLVGLWLREERSLRTGKICHRGGGLIIAGEHAALVLGRPQPPASSAEDNRLRALALAAQGNAAQLGPLFEFEASIARGDVANGFQIDLSTRPGREGQALISLDGFELTSEGHVSQRVRVDGEERERTFEIDTLEPAFDFLPSSPVGREAQDWFTREQDTLGRCLQAVF